MLEHRSAHLQRCRRPGTGGARYPPCAVALLGQADMAYAETVFESTGSSRCSPRSAVDPGHPFPYISNLSLNLAVMVRDPERGDRAFARVKVPPLLPGFVALPDGERFVPLEQMIAAFLGELFPGMEIESCHAFRVIRNADLTLREDEADDLLEAVEMELRRRRFGAGGAPRGRIEPRRPRCGSCWPASSTSGPMMSTRSTGLLDYGGALGRPRPRPSRAEGRALLAGDPAAPRRRLTTTSPPTSSPPSPAATSSSTIPTRASPTT